jgi:hypothetical protein
MPGLLAARAFEGDGLAGWRPVAAGWRGREGGGGEAGGWGAGRRRRGAPAAGQGGRRLQGWEKPLAAVAKPKPNLIPCWNTNPKP